ncbi:MAG: hypothetical protein LBC43_01845 [Bifidobacteriaceae bacterium]|jgi:hypothetical protein|nr:hypothetical protein [Bifidobacteriaceae bacterium]
MKKTQNQPHLSKVNWRLVKKSLIVILSASLIFVGGFWAGSTISSNTVQLESEFSNETVVEVVKGQLGKSSTFMVQGTRANRVTTPNLLDGVYTYVSSGSSDSEVTGVFKNGDILYKVNETPVFVGVGSLPSYRTLSLGDKGDDVEQLFRMLKDKKSVDGNFAGNFDQRMVDGWRNLQSSVNTPNITDEVRLGQIVFVPKLPMQVSLDNNIKVGSLAYNGTGVISSADGDFKFILQLSTKQLTEAPSGADAIVTYSGKTWSAKIGSVLPQTQEDGQWSSDVYNIEIVSSDGKSQICGGDCDIFEGLDNVMVEVEILLAPKVSGLIVPSSAIYTDTDGTLYVLNPEKEKTEIEVEVTSQGMSVVKGLNEGDKVLITSNETNSSS